MNFWLLKYKKLLYISSLSLGSLILISISSFANDLSDPEDSAFSCTSAVNVMDCISQTQSSPLKAADPKSLITGLTNQSFNLTGPVSLNVRYDDQLSWIIDGSYAEKFGNHFAIGLKGSYGPNEHRGNATLGFGITPNQQFKLTYEYLAQNLPFDFTSGNVNEWVNQNAFGGAYRYMFAGNSILKGVEVSGSYTKANSKNLSEAEVYDDNGNMTGILERHIAGGQQKNGLASVIVTPFKYTIIKAGAGYSASSFDTQWDSNQSQSTIAYNVEATHLITPKTLLSTSVNNTATSRAHTVKVSRILPANLEGTVSGQYNFSHVDGISNNGSVSVGLSYPAPKTYTNMFAGSLGDLKSWVQQPVIYNTRVLAISEEKLHKVGIEAIKIPAQQVPVASEIQAIQINDYFSFDKTVYSSIDYVIGSITDMDGKSLDTDLKLGIQYEDGYTAKLYSTDNLPAASLTPGKYLVHVIAKGRRDGNIITQTDNPWEVDVLQNTGIPSANWTNTPLPMASIGQSYGPIDLSKYVQGIEGETFKYGFKSNPTSWLRLTADGKLSADVVTDENYPQVTVTVSATSVISTHNANPDPQSFTIQIAKPNYILPDWTPAWKNQDFPAVTPGLDYQKINQPVNLNPYAPTSGPYLTVTQDPTSGPVPPEKETLLFSITNSMDYNKGYNDAFDCSATANGAWLKIDPNTGALLGTPPVGSTNNYCNAYIKIHSTIAGKDQILTKKINYATPSYVTPHWLSGANLPEVSSNQAYPVVKIDSNHLVSGDTQYVDFTKVKTDQGDQPVNDHWSNFTLTSQDCLDSQNKVWIKIDGTTGELSGTAPAAGTNVNCTVSIKFHSDALNPGTQNQNVQLDDKQIRINSTAPAWKPISNPYVIDFGDSSTYTIKLSDLITTKDGAQATFNPPQITKPLPSNGIPSIYDNNDNQTGSLTLTPTIDDVVGINNPDWNGSFNVTAQTGNPPVVSVPGIFNLKVQANLKYPALNTKVIPEFTVGQAYNLDLNPYKSDGSYNPNSYMNPTTLSDGTTYIPKDNISFSAGSVNTCNLSLDPVTGIASTNSFIFVGDTCQFSFRMQSQKIDGKSNYSDQVTLTLKSANSAPIWIKSSQNILFDGYDPQACTADDANTHCIWLTNAVKPEGRTAQLRFYFTDTGTSTSGNWQIVKDKDNNSYLLRQLVNNKLDATEFPSKALAIAAVNEYTNSTGVGQTFTANLLSNPTKVTVAWVGNINKTFSSANTQPVSIQSLFKSTHAGDGVEINDVMYAEANSCAIQTPSGLCITFDNSSNLMAGGNLFTADNLGKYPTAQPVNGKLTNTVTFKGFYTNATGVDAKTDKGIPVNDVSITLTGALGLKDPSNIDPNNLKIRLDGILTPAEGGWNDGNGNNDYIDLSSFAVSDPYAMGMTGISFSVEGYDSNNSVWQTKKDSGTGKWYLVRQAKFDSTLNKRYLTVKDAQTQSTVTIRFHADGMTDATKQYQFFITPEERQADAPVSYGWDANTTSNAPYVSQWPLDVGKSISLPSSYPNMQSMRIAGAYSDNLPLKMCVLQKNTTLCGDTIVKDVWLRVDSYDANGNPQQATSSPNSWKPIVMQTANGTSPSKASGDTFGNNAGKSNGGKFTDSINSDNGLSFYIFVKMNDYKGGQYIFGSADTGYYTVKFSNVWRYDSDASSKTAFPNLSPTDVTSPTGWIYVR